MNNSSLRTLFAVCLSLQVLSFAVPLRVRAAEQTQLNPIEEQLVFNEAFEPTEGERPNTRGGGARPAPNCPGNLEAIKPLMPSQNYGLTFEERPSILVNLPTTTARKAWLIFRDRTGEFEAKAVLAISRTEGIVRFALPEMLPPLEVGQTYEWKLAFVCGEEIAVDDPLLTGYVTRITRTPEIERELAQKTEIEQAYWYAEEGYWYDLLLMMARSRQESPDNANLKMLWQSLLTSVGLENIASQPLRAID